MARPPASITANDAPTAVIVAGLGVSGQSMMEVLGSRAGRVLGVDEKKPDADLHSFDQIDWDNTDMVMTSPVFNPPPIHAHGRRSRRRRLNSNTTGKPAQWIGITGTNVRGVDRRRTCQRKPFRPREQLCRTELFRPGDCAAITTRRSRRPSTSWSPTTNGPAFAAQPMLDRVQPRQDRWIPTFRHCRRRSGKAVPSSIPRTTTPTVAVAKTSDGGTIRFGPRHRCCRHLRAIRRCGAHGSGLRVHGPVQVVRRSRKPVRAAGSALGE